MATHRHAPARVLVVDDSDDHLWMLRTILQADPYVGVILEAEDGLTALELVRREQPHLVVTDLMIPRLDGLEATRRIKRWWPATKVIVVTSGVTDLVQREAAAAGADALLDKRSLTASLRPLVDRLLTDARGPSTDFPEGTATPPPCPLGQG